MRKLSIYVHIPFCASRCAYCDFVTFANNEHKIEPYVDAILREISDSGARGRMVSSVYFGGGTPSFIAPTFIKCILDKIREVFILSNKCEISIECNPNSVTPEKLCAYFDMGINRLSFGVQSLCARHLEILGRAHSINDVHTALSSAISVGFTDLSIDIIHGIPCAQDETREEYDNQTIKGLIDLLDRYDVIKHISLYSLIVEDGTMLSAQVNSGALVLPSENQNIRYQQQLERELARHNFKKYEVSNFAKQGFKCKHNEGYWSPTSCEYLGFGVSAHSLFNNYRYSNCDDIDEYIAGIKCAVNCETAQANHINPNLSSVAKSKRTNSDIITELLMLCLRTSNGVNINELAKYGYEICTLKKGELEILISAKLIKMTPNRIVVTNKGMFLLNQIIQKLLP